MKKLFLLLTAMASVCLSSLQAGHHKDMTPDSLIHVVTVTWKPEATEAQIQAALDGVVTMGKNFDGITRVWTRTVKAQGERTHAFVMEFKNEAALKEYAGSDAQQEWYKVYIPFRKRSTTFDISN